MKICNHLLSCCFLGLALLSCRHQPAHTNRLIHESSPYLRQHAHNPVNWQPWDETALQQAETENKMLIISIGYAACHWCHVMERESFEDTTVARIMNEHFVNIKVDREERPDVDDVYMAACQLVSESGCGWPLNVFALPDGRPVWAGTYFPRKQWLATLEYFAEEWRKNPEKMSAYAGQLTEGVQRSGPVQPPAGPVDFDQNSLEAPVTALLEEIDYERGGRKGAPKFPMPSNYEFLLKYQNRTGRAEALAAVRTTLDQMARGGIYDHLGGGFARYAVDAAWRVPHFEKMLYDNAQLVSLHAHAFQATGDTVYRRIVEETLTFIEREMTSQEGAFYSSLDADSEEEEGKFYTWQKEEVETALADSALSELFCAAYGITEAGNWEDRNVLYRAETTAALAGRFGLSQPEVRRRLQQARQELFRVRASRVRPGLDNKVLTAWNALMLRGYAAAFRATGTEAYREAALKNGRFLRDVMRAEDNRLRRNYLDGKPAINAFLDDYAQTIIAFIRLYEITFEEEWLYHARGLADYAIEHFRDDNTGLFYYTSDLDPPLAARRMELQDNVIPASNSTLARGLFYLGQYFYDETYLQRARAMCQALSADMTDTLSPDFYTNWYSLWLDLARTPYEVAIVGPRAGELRDRLARHYLPDALLLGGENEGTLELLKNKRQEDHTFIYVCRNKTCKLPVQEVDAALKLMEGDTFDF